MLPLPGTWVKLFPGESIQKKPKKKKTERAPKAGFFCGIMKAQPVMPLQKFKKESDGTQRNASMKSRSFTRPPSKF